MSELICKMVDPYRRRWGRTMAVTSPSSSSAIDRRYAYNDNDDDDNRGYRAIGASPTLVRRDNVIARRHVLVSADTQGQRMATRSSHPEIHETKSLEFYILVVNYLLTLQLCKALKSHGLEISLIFAQVINPIYGKRDKNRWRCSIVNFERIECKHYLFTTCFIDEYRIVIDSVSVVYHSEQQNHIKDNKPITIARNAFIRCVIKVRSVDCRTCFTLNYAKIHMLDFGLDYFEAIRRDPGVPGGNVKREKRTGERKVARATRAIVVARFFAIVNPPLEGISSVRRSVKCSRKWNVATENGPNYEMQLFSRPVAAFNVAPRRCRCSDDDDDDGGGGGGGDGGDGGDGDDSDARYREPSIAYSDADMYSKSIAEYFRASPLGEDRTVVMVSCNNSCGRSDYTAVSCSSIIQGDGKLLSTAQTATKFLIFAYFKLKAQFQLESLKIRLLSRKMPDGIHLPPSYLPDALINLQQFRNWGVFTLNCFKWSLKYTFFEIDKSFCYQDNSIYFVEDSIKCIPAAEFGPVYGPIRQGLYPSGRASLSEQSKVCNSESSAPMGGGAQGDRVAATLGPPPHLPSFSHPLPLSPLDKFAVAPHSAPRPTTSVGSIVVDVGSDSSSSSSSSCRVD
ncbi:hypothetical protein EAG_02372 [Camponotus floridanus]|uniref:Uncharacterized protein n=1 Tax=Camponotus floridanus TaxID=104421 RepID=E2ASL3_CAMFO|nr:hypothetical protein EAG_02372 [Camponotus floridanus]